MALFLPEILTTVFDAVMKNSLQTDETCRQIALVFTQKFKVIVKKRGFVISNMPTILRLEV